MRFRSGITLIVFSVALCLCGSVRALDPESITPYKLKVVLRVADQPLLTKTPIFKGQFVRELRQGLRGALGAMADVEVIDAAQVEPKDQPALWKVVAAKGLQAGLDRPPRDPSSIKTHFVNIDYVDGQYEIEARQYDGLTGLATPTVRRERTADRQFVARAATLLLDRDFGVVGTVTDGGDGKTVPVVFKGSGLKVPLERWVKPGDVFALVQVGADGRTTRVPWVLLQAESAPDENGSCVCKLWPQQKPLKTTGAGFRCLKLGTVSAPVRLRIIDGVRKAPPRDPVKVYLGRRRFERNEMEAKVSDTGFVSTEKDKDGSRYDSVVFVTVVQGTRVLAQVALPLVDERTITLPIRPGDENPTTVTLRYLWEQSLLNEKLMLDDLFNSLNEEIASANKQPALDHAKQALTGLGQRLARYDEEQAELSKTGGKGLDLSKGQRRLAEVKKVRDDLSGWVGRVEKIVNDENSAEVREVKASLERARKFEADGDYDRAIELYEKAVAKTQDAKLGERLQKLKAAWAPKSEAHRKAREFIYNTWPQFAEPAVMKERVQQAQEALNVCREVKDPFGPRKLLAVANSHAVKLAQLVEGHEDDTKLTKEWDPVLEPLKALLTDATKAVTEMAAP